MSIVEKVSNLKEKLKKWRKISAKQRSKQRYYKCKEWIKNKSNENIEKSQILEQSKTIMTCKGDQQHQDNNTRRCM